MTATATPAMTTAAMAAVRPIALVRTLCLVRISLRLRGLLARRFSEASAPPRGCQRGTVAEMGRKFPPQVLARCNVSHEMRPSGRARGEMRTRYHQYCAVARALDAVGARWTLLIVRELVLRGPLTAAAIGRGLPDVPPNQLAERLGGLETLGLARRAVEPRRARRHQLTERR